MLISFFYLIINLFKFWFLEFLYLNLLWVNLLRYFVLFKEYYLEIQTSVIQIRILFYTVKFSGYFLHVNVHMSKSKFELVVFEWINFVYEGYVLDDVIGKLYGYSKM
jgi:hypothetical protein